MIIRRLIASGYIITALGMANPMAVVAQANAGIDIPPAVQTISGVAPDPATGNVNFGCPLGPFTAGTNMAVNQMDSSCGLHYAGPLETAAQSATDISAAIAAIPAYSLVVGAPVSKSPTFGSALQATTSSKAAIVTVNWTSTATISLTGGTTNSATIGIGSTSALAITGATVMCNHVNTNTGALTVGLNLSTAMATTCTFNLPAGWYWAPKAVSGTVTISSAYDQSLG